MRISRLWLQTFFDQPLPEAVALSDALTFHAFEIDGVEKVGEDEVLDVKVTPNRGHDALSHRGIAKELSAILKLPLKNDPFSKTPILEPVTKNISVSLQNPDLCKRYVAGYMRGVRVGESPEWLKNSLEAIGQRSINNVVDATNYVMFNLGQPLHAFDAAKLGQKDGVYAIAVRTAQTGEMLVALDEKEYALSDSMLVIADAHSGTPIGVAGVKGGMPAGISAQTTDIVLESANFDGVSVRKTAQALKLRTDASARFEQVLSPELAGYGMQAVVELIQQIAGGEVVGFVDEYPQPAVEKYIAVTLAQVQNTLGPTFGVKEINDAFTRLGFHYAEIIDPPYGGGALFGVDAPVERLDLQIAEDLIEEIGRIIGYDHVPPLPLPPFSKNLEGNENFWQSEQVRNMLVTWNKPFSEVITSIFAENGEKVVLNKVDGVKPFLRDSLIPGLKGALDRNIKNKDLLGLAQVQLFEIGVVWRGGKEKLMLGLAAEPKKLNTASDSLLDLATLFGRTPDIQLGNDPVVEIELKDIAPGYSAESYNVIQEYPLSPLGRYQSFSKFPYIVRDVAFWTSGTNEQEVAELIKNEAGELCVKITLFDTFQKGDKTSYAFRLIFQSFEKTLTDEEVNGVMEKVYTALKAKGFEIR